MILFDGQIVSQNARGDVSSMGVGAVDKWLGVSATAPTTTTAAAVPPNQAAPVPTTGLASILGTKLVNHKDEVVDSKAAEADIVCLYFSAHCMLHLH
jgi:hypothetical protein